MRKSNRQNNNNNNDDDGDNADYIDGIIRDDSRNEKRTEFFLRCDPFTYQFVRISMEIAPVKTSEGIRLFPNTINTNWTEIAIVYAFVCRNRRTSSLLLLFSSSFVNIRDANCVITIECALVLLAKMRTIAISP